MMRLALFFIEFFKIGLFSVGGGLATLPFIYRMADETGWLTHERIADLIAVAESTPGAIGVNIATYTGFLHSGAAGGIAATLGLITPSVMVILAISRVLEAFKKNETVKAVFSGLRPAATGLIAAAGFGVLRIALIDADASVWYGLLKWREALLFVALFMGIRKFKLHPVAYIAIAGVAGVVLGL